MDSFTVELHSAASSDIYPQNTIASFTNFLPEQLHLEGEWEVALTEISYPSKVFNITEGGFSFSIDRKGSTTYSNPQYLPPGYYPSIQSIVSSMWELILSDPIYHKFAKQPSALVDARVDTASQKVIFSIRNGFYLRLLTKDLQQILGFKPTEDEIEIEQPVSPFVHDLNRIHSMMIYTDFINSSIIGDTKAPILKSFPVERLTNSGDGLVAKSFRHLDFRRVLKHSIHSISVELRSHTGELIPFISLGYTRLSLLFRKIQK